MPPNGRTVPSGTATVAGSDDSVRAGVGIGVPASRRPKRSVAAAALKRAATASAPGSETVSTVWATGIGAWLGSRG